ncbi:hypothetical protein [Marinilabilia salmonicolor]|uniref:hypothetical protein n=1 Tax=Marinilabilia salmonicolor TaxID=989 RepID=UPI00029A506E|nr:hypothetical protein [Marinilabilia salmonicolor]
MKDVLDEYRKQFFLTEYMLFSVQAGLQTRNKNYPIYDKDKINVFSREKVYDTDNTSKLKYDLFDLLSEYLEEIKTKGINEEKHLQQIIKMSDRISELYQKFLFQNRFRIGISQKIINLFLKYMWAADEIPEPCHCPVDGIVKSHIKNQLINCNLPDWSKLDDINDYKQYIDCIREIAKRDNLSIAQWELFNWRRR